VVDATYLVAAFEHRRERVAVGLLRPEALELLVGDPAEQQRPTLRHALAHLAHGDLVGVRRAPAAVPEVAAGVLLGRGRRLHDPVEGDVLDDDDPAHDCLLDVEIN
jgi:hypothetical protein